MRIKTTCIAAISGIAILLGTGCQSMLSHRQDPAPAVATSNVFDFDGIPNREYYAGGGYAIRYIASENGTLFLADDTTKRLLATISLHGGEKYETQYEMKDDKTVIKLYFVPATDI